MPQSLATLVDVHKSYGSVRALDGLTLDVHPRELLALLGQNGAGKTTTISLLLGLQQPDRGAVTLFGASPLEVAARRNIGVMLQETWLPPEQRVGELIDLVTSYYPCPRSVPEVLAMTGTADLAERQYGKLSGGQKRQVDFAVAICGRPQLLFLDEPTSGLDIQARRVVWATIRKLIDEGVAIVLTTHYLEEAEALADRVVVLGKGREIASGSVAEVCALVLRKRVSCLTGLDPDAIRGWPEVEAVHVDQRLHITTKHAEAVVRRLLADDPELGELEVQRAGLAEAFSKLTEEHVQ